MALLETLREAVRNFLNPARRAPEPAPLRSSPSDEAEAWETCTDCRGSVERLEFLRQEIRWLRSADHDPRIVEAGYLERFIQEHRSAAGHRRAW